MTTNKERDIALRSLGSMVIERNLWRKACYHLASQVVVDGSQFDIEKVALKAYGFVLKEWKKETNND